MPATWWGIDRHGWSAVTSNHEPIAIFVTVLRTGSRHFGTKPSPPSLKGFYSPSSKLMRGGYLKITNGTAITGH
jgi:hypothetical protein